MKTRERERERESEKEATEKDGAASAMKQVILVNTKPHNTDPSLNARRPAADMNEHVLLPCQRHTRYCDAL